jgi:hypothetical protein
MLKWAMRIVAVGGALLAMAVGTAAWMHRTQGRVWNVATPTVMSEILISPRHIHVQWHSRHEFDDVSWGIGRYGASATGLGSNPNSEIYYINYMRLSDFKREWHGFGLARGDHMLQRPSYTAVLCPTWAVLAVLLLPMGLWAGIGWRQRRRVKAGHCVNCGYDLRATPEKCPECGRAVKISAE